MSDRESSFEENALKSTPQKIAPPAIEDRSPADTEVLLRKAHRVLLHCMPGAALPDELSRVRALLDTHMFGRDKRSSRDDVVEVARLIDRTLPRAAA